MGLHRVKLSPRGQEVAEYGRRDPGNSLRQWLETRYRDREGMRQDIDLLNGLGLP